MNFISIRKPVQLISKLRHLPAQLYSSASGCGKKGLVIGMYEKEHEDDVEPRLTHAGEAFDAKHEGKLSELVRSCQMRGNLGKAKLFSTFAKEYETVCVVGLGKENAGFSKKEHIESRMENIRIAAGIAARKVSESGCETIFVDGMEQPEQAAEGSALAIWKYQENKNPANRKHIPKLELFESAEVDAWTKGLFKADAQNLARTLSDAPANQITPTGFAQTAIDALCPCGLSVEIRNKSWIEQNNLKLLLGSSKGSCEPPLVLEVHYSGDDKGGKPIALVGVGSTFSEPGFMRKREETFDDLRANMTGAASVIASLRAAAALNLPLNLVGMIALYENMTSGIALKPGDVVEALNGKSIRITSASNFNCLVLADMLHHVQASVKPRAIVDVAALGNGIGHVLGQAASGVFTNTSSLWRQAQIAGSLSGDRVWQLPLWDCFSHELRVNPTVDYDISEPGYIQSTVSASFLQDFVPCVDWLHFDTSNTGAKIRTGMFPYLERGSMSGRPVRTIIELLVQLGCNEEKKPSA